MFLDIFNLILIQQLTEQKKGVGASKEPSSLQHNSHSLHHSNSHHNHYFQDDQEPHSLPDVVSVNLLLKLEFNCVLLQVYLVFFKCCQLTLLELVADSDTYEESAHKKSVLIRGFSILISLYVSQRISDSSNIYEGLFQILKGSIKKQQYNIFCSCLSDF